VIDTLTITTSTWQLIVTPAHYAEIAKALDCEEYLIVYFYVTVVSATL